MNKNKDWLVRYHGDDIQLKDIEKTQCSFVL